MQEDFVNGVFGFPEAKEIIEPINKKIEEYHKNGDLVLFTQDSHTMESYEKTQEGKVLPPHCLVNTKGFDIIKEFDQWKDLEKIVISKKWDSFSIDPYLLYELVSDYTIGTTFEFKTPISCIPYSEMLPNGVTESDISIYYVCRTYLTKHGGGTAYSMYKEFANTHETNVCNQFQGEFYSYLWDSQFIGYSISCVERTFKASSRYIVQTCCDIVGAFDLPKILPDPCLTQVCTYSPDFDTLCK